MVGGGIVKNWKKLDTGIEKKLIFVLAVLFIIAFMPFQTKVLYAQEIVTFPSAPTPISPQYRWAPAGGYNFAQWRRIAVFTSKLG